ncbi:MAG: sarcosine oxidase subunit gamma family protein [Paracoccaceae bacterium]
MSNAAFILNGAAFEGAVTVTEAGLRGMITLRGDLGSEAMEKAVKASVGVALPKQRKIKSGKRGAVAWMSPDELLLLVDYDQADMLVAKMKSILAEEHHLVVNVSDARSMFTLSGAGAREVLAKGAPVDLSHSVFGKGAIRRSRIGQIAAAFWTLDGEELEVVCFRSVGAFMYDWLSTAAAKGSLPEYL